MEKLFTITEVVNLNLNIETASQINLSPSQDRSLIIKCDFNPELVTISEENDSNRYKLKISYNDKKKDINELLFNFTNIDKLIKSFLKGEVPIKISSEVKDIVILNIFVPDTIKKMKFNLNKSKTHIDGLIIEKFNMNGNNSEIELTKSCRITSPKINFNNCAAVMPLNSAIQKMDVNLNNSKTKFLKDESFAEGVFLTGIFNKVKGEYKKGNAGSTIIINGNHSKINFT